jgi:hypothetical protein
VNKPSNVAPSISDLLDRLDDLLPLNGTGETDVRTTALVAMGFCDLLQGFFDSNQLRGLQIAHEYWNGLERGLEPEQYRSILDVFGNSIGHVGDLDADKTQATYNRLVWCSLNSNTDFSSYAADFLVNLGGSAGLSSQQMQEVLKHYVPGL